MKENRVGGLWMMVPSNNMAYAFARPSGLPQGLHSAAIAGGIHHGLILNHHPPIVACSKGPMMPYMSSRGGADSKMASFANTAKSILARMLSFGNFASQTGLADSALNAARRIAGVPAAPSQVIPGINQRPGSDLAPAEDTPAKRKRTVFGGGWF